MVHSQAATQKTGKKRHWGMITHHHQRLVRCSCTTYKASLSPAWKSSSQSSALVEADSDFLTTCAVPLPPLLFWFIGNSGDKSTQKPFTKIAFSPWYSVVSTWVWKEAGGDLWVGPLHSRVLPWTGGRCRVTTAALPCSPETAITLPC